MLALLEEYDLQQHGLEGAWVDEAEAGHDARRDPVMFV